MLQTKAFSESPLTAAVFRAVERLRALHDADRAVIDLIALGPGVIPALRDFLCRREPSGLFQPRCNAVSVLSTLRADEVLLDFLRRAPAVEIADPVERTGEDAVINAAARALGHRRDDACFAILMTIAAQRPLAGVIEALGNMGRNAAIPRLVAGLSDDFTRHVASAALLKLGTAARPMLIETALRPVPSAAGETATSRRTRWSAIGLLSEIGLTIEQWSLLKPLTDASDVRLAALACRLALATNQPLPDREAAVRGLIRLLRSSDWLLSLQIEGWLAESGDLAIRIINRAVDAGDGLIQNETVRRSLLRVIAGSAAKNLASSSALECRDTSSSRPAGPATNCPRHRKRAGIAHAFSAPRPPFKYRLYRGERAAPVDGGKKPAYR